MKRSMLVFVVLLLAAVGCGGGGHSKPCTGGTDPAGRACTRNTDCTVTCVCEKSNKRYRVSADECKEDSKCASASFMCNSACLITLGVWTDEFCTAN